MRTKKFAPSITQPKPKSSAGSRQSRCASSATGPRKQENHPAKNDGKPLVHAESGVPPEALVGHGHSPVRSSRLQRNRRLCPAIRNCMMRGLLSSHSVSAFHRKSSGLFSRPSRGARKRPRAIDAGKPASAIGRKRNGDASADVQTLSISADRSEVPKLIADRLRRVLLFHGSPPLKIVFLALGHPEAHSKRMPFLAVPGD